MATSKDKTQPVNNEEDAKVIAARIIESNEKMFKAELPYDDKGTLGVFVFKYPNLKDEIAIDVDMEQNYLHGATFENLAKSTQASIKALASMRVCLVDSPKEFDLDNLEGFESLAALFKPFGEWRSLKRPFDEQPSTG